jgi:nucleoside-diphosphate-sugar epimerase
MDYIDKKNVIITGMTGTIGGAIALNLLKKK